MKKAESDHIAKVVALGCICCSNIGIEGSPSEAHHINSGAMGKKSSHKHVIPLCHRHHRTGGYGIAVHAGKKEWERRHGTEIQLLKEVLEMIK